MNNPSNREIANHVLMHRGASVSLLGGVPRFVEARDGDVYAVGGAPNKYGEAIASLFIPVSEFDADAVQQGIDYVTKHRAGGNPNWTGVGFWIDDEQPDTVWIDAIDLIMGRELAESVGRERGELAIYALQRDEVVGL